MSVLFPVNFSPKLKKEKMNNSLPNDLSFLGRHISIICQLIFAIRYLKDDRAAN